MERTKITVETTIVAHLAKVWDCWTDPQHITGWNFASDDWHCPAAKNDLKPGGRFCFTMASKDGEMSFDFEGTYDSVDFHKQISYTMDDQRQATINFTEINDRVQIVETFEAETMNSVELQRDGWKSILENFRKYVETM